MYAPTKVSAAEAYQAFLSILELNGMAIVPAGRYLKIVESGRVEGRPIPLYTGNDSVPDGDRFVTRLQRVSNITAEAWLSLAVVAVWAIALTAISIRAFARSAVS